MRHVDPQVVRLLDGVGSPHLTQKLAMSQHFARVLDEEAEQRILCGRQPDLASVESDQARRQVHFKFSGAKHADLRARLRVALRDAKARQQFEWVAKAPLKDPNDALYKQRAADRLRRL